MADTEKNQDSKGKRKERTIYCKNTGGMAVRKMDGTRCQMKIRVASESNKENRCNYLGSVIKDDGKGRN